MQSTTWKAVAGVLGLEVRVIGIITALLMHLLALITRHNQLSRSTQWQHRGSLTKGGDFRHRIVHRLDYRLENVDIVSAFEM